MNKSDLIDALSTKENLTHNNASEIINLIFDGFTDKLKKGGRIELRGFGSFSVREYDGYTGRNPKTGAGIQVGPKKGTFFKVGKELRERVNGGLDCGNMLLVSEKWFTLALRILPHTYLLTNA